MIVRTAAIISSLILASGLYAQPQGTVKKTFVQNGYVYQLRQRGKDVMQRIWAPVDYNWTEQAWTDNDVEYQKIANSASNPAVSDLTLLKQLAETRAKLSLKSSKSDRFYFACLVDAAAKRHLLNQTKHPSEQQVAVAFMSLEPQPSSPTSHRLRFILEMSAFPSPYLLPIAARLIQRNPEDYEVRLRYAKALSLSSRLQDCERAVKQLEDIKAEHPNDIKTLTYLGAALWHLSDLDHKKETLKRASVCYEEYLKAAPSNAPFRPEAERIVGVIKRELQRWAQK